MLRPTVTQKFCPPYQAFQRGSEVHKIIRLSILSCTARRCVHCDCVRIQLPEHQYKDHATLFDRKRRRCLNATLLSHNNFSYRNLTFREFFDEMTVKRDPPTLTPCSRGLRVITVSATVIVASRQSGADGHHTASSTLFSAQLFPGVRSTHDPCI